MRSTEWWKKKKKSHTPLWFAIMPLVQNIHDILQMNKFSRIKNTAKKHHMHLVSIHTHKQKHRNTDRFSLAAYLVKAITYFFDAKNLCLFWLFCILHLNMPINTKFYWMVFVYKFFSFVTFNTRHFKILLDDRNVNR